MRPACGGKRIWWLVVGVQGGAIMSGLGKATGRMVHVLLALFYGAFVLFGLIYLWRELP